MNPLRRILPLIGVSLGGLLIVASTVVPAIAAGVDRSVAASSTEVAGAKLVVTYAQAQPGQDEFVPIDELPPEDRLPAAPLLIAAYAFVWLALLTYLWSIWRRLGGIEREIAEVARRVPGEADRGQG